MKFASGPPADGLMLFVTAVAPCLEELGIAVRAADVLWRPAAMQRGQLMPGSHGRRSRRSRWAGDCSKQSDACAGIDHNSTCAGSARRNAYRELDHRAAVVCQWRRLTHTSCRICRIRDTMFSALLPAALRVKSLNKAHKNISEAPSAQLASLLRSPLRETTRRHRCSSKLSCGSDMGAPIRQAPCSRGNPICRHSRRSTTQYSK